MQPDKNYLAGEGQMPSPEEIEAAIERGLRERTEIFWYLVGLVFSRLWRLQAPRALVGRVWRQRVP